MSEITALITFFFMVFLVQCITISVEDIRKNKGFKRYLVSTYQRPDDFQLYTKERQIEWQHTRVSRIQAVVFIIMLFILAMISYIFV